MIKAITDNGELEIAVAEVEWAVVYTNETWGTEEIIYCVDETEARMYGGILKNARVESRTVLMTAWGVK